MTVSKYNQRLAHNNSFGIVHEQKNETPHHMVSKEADKIGRAHV